MAKHVDVTDKIIGAFYTVYNTLGYGFSEKVYQAAMVIELRMQGVQVEKEHRITVYYKGQPASEFYADLLVEGVVVVELKSVKKLIDEHRAQLLNYLKSSRYEVGLLLNFGPETEIERKSYSNSRKGNLSWSPPNV